MKKFSIFEVVTMNLEEEMEKIYLSFQETKMKIITFTAKMEKLPR